MLKTFKDIVSEVAQPISQGEKNFKDLHVKADNRDLVPGVTDQDFLFKGRPRRMDTPTASYEKMNEPDDQSVKAYDKGLKREEVEQVDEVQSRRQASAEWDYNKKQMAKGDRPSAALADYKNKTEYMKAATKKKTNEEAEQIDELDKKTLGRYAHKAHTQVVKTNIGLNKKQGGMATKGVSPEDFKRKYGNRVAGTALALKNMRSEEVENVEEAYGDKTGKTATGTRWSKTPNDKEQKVSVTVHSDGRKHVFTGSHSYVAKKLKAEHGMSMYDVKFKNASDMKENVEQFDEAANHRAAVKAAWRGDEDAFHTHMGIKDDTPLSHPTYKASKKKYKIISSMSDDATIADAVKKLKEEIELDEKTLSSAEIKKREEVVKAIKRKHPDMDKSMAYKFATATAKRVAEDQQFLGPESKIKDNKHHNTTDYIKKNVSFAKQRNSAVDAMIKHDCAKHVAHEEWGVGSCIPEAHTIVETAEGEGYVSHYDVMFDHGVEHNVPVEDLQILVSESHEHTRRNMKEDIDYDYEGEMAKAELRAICDKADALANMMEDDMQLEAWLQSKITKAKYMIDAVYDYLMYSNRNQAGTGPTPSTVTPSYNQSAAMTDTYGSFLNRMGEEVEIDEAGMGTLQSYMARRKANPSQRGTHSPEKYTNLAQAKVDQAKRNAGTASDDEAYRLNKYKMAGGKVKVAANEEVNLEEGDKMGPVSVKREKYKWGDVVRVSHGISHGFVLHPHHQEMMKNLKDGESTSFTDETNSKIHARREGDTIHLKNPGSNTPTPVDRKHFTEEVVVDEAMSMNQKKEFADLAHPKGQITYADKIVGAKLQAAKEKARKGKSEEKMEDKEEMKEEIDLSIISDEEKAKLEEIMKAE